MTSIIRHRVFGIIGSLDGNPGSDPDRVVVCRMGMNRGFIMKTRTVNLVLRWSLLLIVVLAVAPAFSRSQALPGNEYREAPPPTRQAP